MASPTPVLAVAASASTAAAAYQHQKHQLHQQQLLLPKEDLFDVVCYFNREYVTLTLGGIRYETRDSQKMSVCHVLSSQHVS